MGTLRFVPTLKKGEYPNGHFVFKIAIYVSLVCGVPQQRREKARNGFIRARRSFSGGVLYVVGLKIIIKL